MELSGLENILFYHAPEKQKIRDFIPIFNA